VITKRNADILKEMKVEPVDQKRRRYRSNWRRHGARMNSNRMPKIIVNYRPNGRRPVKRLTDEAKQSLTGDG